MKRLAILSMLLVITGTPSVTLSNQIYVNRFDNLNGMTVNSGTPDGNISIDSGQLKLEGAKFNYRGAYASIEYSQFDAPYTGRLSDLNRISWAFNLSNMDDPAGGVNNNFKIHLVSSNLRPDDSDQFSYFLGGGGYVGNRMLLYRGTHTYSPYGNSSAILMDISEGLSPLPQKGSFRVDFIPDTGRWDLYAEYGNTYVDPRNITRHIGTAYDNTYANDFMPYITLDGENSGAVFIDNLTVEASAIPEPSVLVLGIMIPLSGFFIRRFYHI